MDPIQQIQAFNADREPERLQLKYRAMRASTVAFLRGSCHLFHARLPRGGLFKSAPPAWVCGDLHLENAGSYLADNGLVHVDINDFDEAALAPASWDLLRLLCSARIVAAAQGLGRADTEALAEAMAQAGMDGYAGALAGGKAGWIERDTATGLVRSLLDGLRHRAHGRFLDSRTTRHRGHRRLRVDGHKALPASDAQRQAVMAFMADFARQQPEPRFFTPLDVARRIAGTGSLGLPRYVVLVEGTGAPDGQALLDLKWAPPSSLRPRLKLPQPDWPSEAHRIIALQTRLQAVPMAWLQPVRFDARHWVLRALQPAEDRVQLRKPVHSTRLLCDFVQGLGRLAAWAQLRSAGRQGSACADELIDFGQRRKWRLRLLDAARDCARQVQADAAAFNQAWDDGALAP